MNDHDSAYDGLVDGDGRGQWAFGTSFDDPLAGVDTTVPDDVDLGALARYCLGRGMGHVEDLPFQVSAGLGVRFRLLQRLGGGRVADAETHAHRHTDVLADARQHGLDSVNVERA